MDDTICNADRGSSFYLRRPEALASCQCLRFPSCARADLSHPKLPTTYRDDPIFNDALGDFRRIPNIEPLTILATEQASVPFPFGGRSYHIPWIVD